MDEQRSTTSTEWFREMSARSQALRTYAAAHDRLATASQVCYGMGEVAAGELQHRHALLVLRAFRAEVDDPEPAS